MKELKKLILWSKAEASMIKKYKVHSEVYNKSMTLGITRILSLILILAICTGAFSVGGLSRIIICSASFIAYVILYRMCKKGKFENRMHIAFYISMTIGATLSILLSIFISPDQKAAILLGIFFIVPMAQIDYFYRKLSFSVIVFLVHSIMAFELKGVSIATVDSINCLCVILIGTFIGHVMQQTKLTSFELKEELISERETDILTGLKNRRKMIELFSAVQEKKTPEPSCAVLIDIDHFKQYNDTYGHTAGDEFLRMFGETLLEFQRQHDIQFFRHGGEEFAAFLWDYSNKQHQQILESIREAIENMDIKNKRTVSIGYVNCVDHNYLNLENALDLADIALYEAKAKGRNQVVRFKSTVQQ